MCEWVLNAPLKCIAQKKIFIFLRDLFTTQELLVLTRIQRSTTDFIGIVQWVIFLTQLVSVSIGKNNSPICFHPFFAVVRKSDRGFEEAFILKLFKVNNGSTRAMVKSL